MVGLGEVELARRDDRRGDLVEAVRGQHLLVRVAGGLGGDPLLLRAEQDHGAVLGTHVVALAHALGRVVRLPEHPEQVLVRHEGRVEDHPDRLGVAGPTRTDLFVGRVGRVTTRVADRGGQHPGQLPELPLGAPEAAQAELGHLRTRRIGREQPAAEHLVAGGHGQGLGPSGQRLLRGDQLGFLESEHPLRLADRPDRTPVRKGFVRSGPPERDRNVS